MNLGELVSWLNAYLEIGEIRDYPNAFNGLQLENSGRVTRVAAAVDAAEPVIAAAIECGCDLLLVHHGLLWGGATPITGAFRRKLKLALDHDLAVYSAHLPLDLHPECGNNAVLARELQMPPSGPFLETLGRPIGRIADWKIPLAELLRRIEGVTGRPVHLAPGGPQVTARVALASGGAGAEAAEAAVAGADTFITGEGPHWSFTAAEELGVNLVYAGHYATETFGVRALATLLEKNFGLPWEFLDHPTGL